MLSGVYPVWPWWVIKAVLLAVAVRLKGAWLVKCLKTAFKSSMRQKLRKDGENMACPVCLDDVYVCDSTFLGCGHGFHIRCMSLSGPCELNCRRFNRTVGWTCVKPHRCPPPPPPDTPPLNALN